MAYLVPEDACYVIPVKKLKGRTLFSSVRTDRGKSKWEKYREGWCQMACPYDEIRAEQDCDATLPGQRAVQMAICPLKVLR